ncbi:MAG: DUF308 domain-containing protein [Oscillospiraceae bacterium]|nr:DUF308 domain-containing protein [Oscillospiraceae bacterium]
MNGTLSKKILRILWLASGILMICAGVYSLFHGATVIGTISRVLGVCAIAAGITSLLVKLAFSMVSGRSGGLALIGSVVLILFGILLFSTRLMMSLGKIMFIIVGIILIYEAVQSLSAALATKESEGKWFLSRVIVSCLLALVGIWILTNARRVFVSVAGLIVGAYFVVHGIWIILDWVGNTKYNANFGFLDD